LKTLEDDLEGLRKRDALRDVQEAAEDVRRGQSREIRLTLAAKKALAAGATPAEVERAKKKF
jgi:hypothetical protein